MSKQHLFEPTRHVSDISDCYFYHVMDLPGYGTVGNEWDLRGNEDAYLGGVSFSAKRVLELGTASGYLCRYMESKGADVIGFDLSHEQSWEVVPFAKFDTVSFRDQMKDHIRRLNNGWWLAHRVFESKAKVVYGNIYSIPDEIGPVDIATFGSILLHLRDPFHALYNALKLTRETVIVTEAHPFQATDSGLGSVAPLDSYFETKLLKDPITSKEEIFSSGGVFPGTLYFLPDPRINNPSAAVTWWCFPPEVICRFLGVLGFEATFVTEHCQLYQGKKTRLYTVVGKRTQDRRG